MKALWSPVETRKPLRRELRHSEDLRREILKLLYNRRPFGRTPDIFSKLLHRKTAQARANGFPDSEVQMASGDPAAKAVKKVQGKLFAERLWFVLQAVSTPPFDEVGNCGTQEVLGKMATLQCFCWAARGYSHLNPCNRTCTRLPVWKLLDAQGRTRVCIGSAPKLFSRLHMWRIFIGRIICFGASEPFSTWNNKLITPTKKDNSWVPATHNENPCSSNCSINTICSYQLYPLELI